MDRSNRLAHSPIRISMKPLSSASSQIMHQLICLTLQLLKQMAPSILMRFLKKPIETLTFCFSVKWDVSEAAHR